MTVKDRLKAFIKHKKISIRAFCREIGVSETYVSSMRNSIQPHKLKIISEVYPELNTSWLITGEGEMIRKLSNNQALNHEKILQTGIEVFKDKLIEMFKNGEIYSASVVLEMNHTISLLNREIAKLEDEIKILKDENSLLKTQIKPKK